MRNFHPLSPLRLLAATLAFGAATATTASLARADEILVRDPVTCERKTIKAADITAETWLEVSYREKERGPVKTVPTPDVVDVKRTTNDPQAAKLQAARDELSRGNLREARSALQDLTGAGWRTDE